MKQDDKWEILRALGTFGNLGFTLAASVAVGLLLGRWLDNLLNSSPWATICGIILGMGTGMWSMYHMIIKRK